MRPRIYVKEGLFNKLNAELINNKGKKIREINGELEVLKCLSHLSGDSAVFLGEKNKSLKYALTEKYDIVFSRGVIKNHDAFMETMEHFYLSRGEKPLYLENPENIMSDLNFNHRNYVNEQIRANAIKQKKLKRNLVCLGLTAIIFIGAYVHRHHLDKVDKEQFDDLNNSSISAVDLVYKTTTNNVNVDDFVTFQIEENNPLDTVKEILGTGLNATDKENISWFLKTDAGEKIVDACESYDVDLAFVMALAVKEFSIDDSNFYTTTADGSQIFNAFQIDSRDDGKVFEVENSKTGQTELITRNYENSTNPDTHFTIAVVSINDLLKSYGNNYILASIAYNMGPGVADIIIAHTMEVNKMTKEEVLNNWDLEFYNDLANEIYQNPHGCENIFSTDIIQNYQVTFNYLNNWQYSTYGGYDYAKIAMSYLVEDYSYTSSPFYQNDAIKNLL